MIKRMIAMTLAFVVLVSTTHTVLFGEETTGETSRFIDMPDDWSTEALERAVSNGLINGYNNQIMPKDNLTRAQMAAIINRAFGAEGVDALEGYSDVPSDAWYYEDMGKAVYMGTFKGSDGLLNPNDRITRQEVIVGLARVFKLSGADQSILDGFSDKNAISQWAKDGVASMVAAGYISGSNGYIYPKNYITRAEFAKVMDNLVKTYMSTTDTYSANLFGNVVVNAPDVVLEDMTINGDLIVADGVGDASIHLDNVVVAGRTVIRGGGTNTVRVSGDSRLGNIVVGRVGGMVRIHVEQAASVGTINIDGNENVVLEGNYGRVIVKSHNISMIAQKATIQSIVVEGNDLVVQTNAGAMVQKISSTGINTQIDTKSGSEIDEVLVYNSGARINGDGKVLSVIVQADDTRVTTVSTVVTASSQASNVYLGDSEVEPGSSTGEVSIPLTTIPAGVVSSSGGVSKILVESMTISALQSSITNHQGSLAMSVVTFPSYATSSDVIWEVTNGTGAATISSEGLLTAVANGLVTVLATTTDGSEITTSKVISISGQLSNINTLSNLKISGKSLEGFSSVKDTYMVTVAYGTKTPPLVVGVPADSKAAVKVTNASDVGSDLLEERTTLVTVTAEDGVATKVYRVIFVMDAPAVEVGLKDLRIDNETVDGFSGTKNQYSVVLPKFATVTPVVTADLIDPNASYSVSDAVDVTSADESERTSLVTVTAEDVSVSKTYAVTFEVTPPNEFATLEALKVDGKDIDAFNSSISTYTYDLATFTTATPDVTASPTYSGASLAVKSAIDVTSDLVGERTTVITVTAEDGTTTKEYKVVFNVLPNTDASLSALKIDSLPIQGFNPEDMTYTYTLPTWTEDAPPITVTLADEDAEYSILDASDVTSTSSQERTTVITVTAEDQVTKKIYEVEFNVTPPSTVNTLSDLRVDGLMVDDFESYTGSYEMILEYDTTIIPQVSASKTDEKATMVINQATSLTSLVEIDRKATVRVTAEDGISVKTYSILFTLAPPPKSTVASLSGITVDGNSLSAFAPTTFIYDVELEPGTTEIPLVGGSLTDLKASMSVTQATNIQSDTESERTATIFVTAEDGITTKQYKVEFNVTPSSTVNTLSELRVDGLMVDDFESYTEAYEIILEYDTTTIPEVSASKTDEKASMVINQATSLTSLVEIDRKATVRVTAEDGISVKTYSVLFTLAPPPKSTDASLSDITVDGDSLSAFAPTTFLYTIELEPGTTAIPLVGGSLTDLNASKSVTQATNIQSDIESERTATIFVTAEDGSSETYWVRFEVLLNDDASLESILVNGVPIDDFNPEVLNYTFELGPDETSPAAIDIVLNDPSGAEGLVVDAKDVTSTDEGERTTTITVTAEDRAIERKYTVLFNLAD